MRVIDQNQHTLTDYDLSSGTLVATVVIRPDAEPVDNVTKFAWEEGDYEQVQMYIPNPKKSPAQQLAELKAQLAATDYKIIKSSEYQLIGKALPYDVEQLHAQRQMLRDQINQLLQEETQ